MSEWSSFEIAAPGKWVLSGEHSVLRGATAVALPHPEFVLKLRFARERGKSLAIEPADADIVVRDLLRSLADEWESTDRVFPMPEGVLSIQSTIPVGAGLGSSAALCVALTGWMSEPLSIGPEERFEFAKRLEHRFHGRSSGMDIAVVMSKQPISYSMEKGPSPLPIGKIPRFTFHDTGLRSRTSECVLRVERIREDNPTLGMRLDETMSAASRETMEGLFAYDSGDHARGIELIARGIGHARECFYCWEIVPGEAKRLEEKLLSEGARAVKLTGAGGGGMVVALWP
jgi:mevalonate kinase